MERRGTRWNGGLDGTERDQMERRTCWNGEGPDGTAGPDGTEGHKMERRVTRWNGGTQDGKEGDQMEWRGTRRNGET